MKINILKKQILFLFLVLLGTTVNGQPSISSFTPIYGAAGSSVTISGSGFDATASNNVVYFGNAKATITAASTSSLTVTVPTGATYQPIRVVNKTTSKIGESADKFILSYGGMSTAITSAKFTSLNINSSSTPSISGLNSSSSSDRHVSAVGDLNGDGKPEIIISEYSNGKLDVYSNATTSGSLALSNFSTKTQFATLANPSEVDLVDMNNDGLLDVLVSAPASGKLSVFINNSSSSSISFATRQDVTVISSFTFYKAFDANNDGKLDICGFVKGGSTLYVYPNSSSFPGTAITLGTATQVTGITGMVDMDCGDLNNDGKIDVLLAKNSVNPTVLINTTASGTISFSSFTLTANGSVYAVKIADLNRDGNNEILCGLSNNTGFNIFQNNFSSGTMSASSFASPINLANMNPGTASSKIRTWAIDIADLDGDGAPDIITGLYNSNTTQTGYIMVAKNAATMGSGTLAASNFTVNSNIGAASFGKFANALVVDLDGDGKIDIVSNSDSKIYLLRNTMTKTALLTDVSAGGAILSSGKTFDVSWNSSTSGPLTKTFTLKFADITASERISMIQSGASSNWKVSVTKAGVSSTYSSLTGTKSSSLCYNLGANTSSVTIDLKYDNTTAGTYYTNVTLQLADATCATVSGDAYVFRCTCIVAANQVKTSTGGNLSTQLSGATGSGANAPSLNVDAGDTATIKIDNDNTVKKLKIVGGTTLTLKSTKPGGAKISIDSTFEVEDGAELKVSGSDTVSFELKKGAKAYIKGNFKAESEDGVKEPKVVFKGEGEVHFEGDFDVDEKSSVKFTHTDKKHVYFDGNDQNISGAGKVEFDEHCHVHFGDGTGSSGAYQRCTTNRETKFYGKVTVEKYTEVVSDAPASNSEADWNAWSPKVKLKHDGKNQGSIAPLTSGSTITGGVQWEMYNSAVRSYRTVSFPLKNPMNLSQITDNLVVSGTYTGTNKDSINNSCSYCLPSCYYWDEPTSAWVAYVGSSTANKVPPGQGIMLFFRGMKNYGQGLGDPTASADPGVIDIKGEIYTGSLTKNLSYASTNANLKGYNLVGNPYPSNIDFQSLTLTNVANQFAVYDPKAKNYNVWSKSKSGTITRVGTTAFTTGPERLSSVIEAGAAFFAVATNSNSSITFDESDKTDSVPNTTAFKTVEKPMPCNNLKIALEYADTTGRPYMDQTFMEWDSRSEGAQLSFDEYDMHKLFGGYLGIGTMTSSDEWLAIDVRPFTQSQIQSLPLKIKTYEKVDHIFKFKTCPVGSDTLYKVKIVDKVLHKSYDVKDSGSYRFTVATTDSFKDNRFDVVVERLFDPEFADVKDIKKDLKQNANIGKYAIYPIPVTNGTINIAGGEDNDIKEVQVTDLQGQVVMKLNSSNQLIGSRVALPNSVKSGIYMVKIKGLKGEINQKVLINN